MEALIGALGVVVSVAMFFIGVRRGEKQERERRQHETQLESERRQHQTQLEADRRLRELASKAADEYVKMSRSHHDGGPHALSTLSLELLGSDAIIREAIQEMHLRSGADPWGGSSSHVEGLNLVEFFRYVRVNGINPANPTTSVEVIAKRMRESAGK